MKSMGWMIGGLVGGAIGAASWAAIAYYAHLESGWIAWIIGVIVGASVAASAKDAAGAGTGLGAACIAAASVLGGKYIVVHLIVSDVWNEARNETGTDGPVVDDEMLVSVLAQQLADQREAAGETLEWPNYDEDDETVAAAETFPPGIWQDAQDRWDHADASYKQQHREYVEANLAAMMSDLRDAMVQGGFMASFTLWDLLWLFLAVGSAWRIGSGTSPGGAS